MNKEQGHLNVDLADPRAIEARIPQIEEMVEAKRHLAITTKEDFETWKALLQRLRKLAGLVLRFETPKGPQIVHPPKEAVDAIVRVVEREARPIMAVGVSEILTAEGHEVESPNAVHTLLLTAVDDDRLKEVGPKTFAPHSLDAEFFGPLPALQAVPEAHLGLDGPPPQSKAEAAIRVLGSDPSRRWTTPHVGEVMVDQGWMANSDSDFASLAATLSRLVSEGKIFRPQRGQYQFAPMPEEGE